MKKTKSIYFIALFLLTILVAVLSLQHSFSVSAETLPNESGHIMVTGTGEITVSPDTAVVTVGVETLNSSVLTAQKENSETMKKVIQTLLDNNVLKEDIKTKSFYIREKYDYNKGQEFMGNQVSNFIEFKTNDIENLTSLLTKLTESGANAFNGINFTLSDSAKAYSDALKSALENAKEKAGILNVNNSNLVLKSIKEQYTYVTPCYYDNLSLAKSLVVNESSVESGMVKVCATIQVCYSVA